MLDTLIVKKRIEKEKAMIVAVVPEAVKPGYIYKIVLVRHSLGNYAVSLSSRASSTHIDTFSNPLAAQARAVSLGNVLGTHAYIETVGFDEDGIL